MSIDPADPDLAIPLRLDRTAPRAARYCAASVGSPSPDLRDVVKLLTSELVTMMVEQRTARAGELIALRVWMAQDTVRIELEGRRELFVSLRAERWPEYDLMLVEKLSDRWSIETDEHHGWVWLEIDRRQGGGREGAGVPGSLRA
jgi:hypothetical protein